MATQTRTQRQAAAKKAAATRRQNESQRRGAAARRSVRRSGRAAGAASQDARGAASQGTRAVARGLEAGALRIDALGRQLERALLIQVGAVLEARDAATRTLTKYSSRGRVRTRLRQLERRGETALRRSRWRVERGIISARRDIDRQSGALKADAAEIVGRLTPSG